MKAPWTLLDYMPGTTRQLSRRSGLSIKATRALVTAYIKQGLVQSRPARFYANCRVRGAEFYRVNG